MPSHQPLLLRLFILITLANLSMARNGNLTFEQPSDPYTWTDCASPPNSTASSQLPSYNATEKISKFEDNVVALLEALPSSAASTGFASLSKGNGGDLAFVRGLCRGDALGACYSCLQNAAQRINDQCNNGSRRAGIWYDMCFVSYADTNVSTDRELQYRSILYNVGKVRNGDGFENTFYALMRSLADRVVNGSDTTSSPAVAPMFATGKAMYDPNSRNGTMHGLLQCMRDLTAAGCQRCLQDSIPQLPSCCYGHQGGVVLAYNCYLRVEIYTYYDSALDAAPSTLSLAPSPSSFPAIIGEKQSESFY